MKSTKPLSQFRATSQSRTTHRWSPLPSVVLCAILFLCSIPVTHADGPAFDEPRLFGTGSDGTRSVAVGDVNGDGALDLVTGNQCGHKGCPEPGEQNVVYLNDGAGNFFPEAAHNIGSALDYTYDVAVGDFDGDGALDVVVGNFREQNGVYLNDGTGSFPFTSAYTRTLGTGADDTMSVAVGDLDGDGALDIIVGNYQSPNAVYLNDGTGGFPYTSAFGPGDDDARSIAVGDMDGDGHLDIIVGDDGAPNLVYLNNGNGSFPYTSAYTRTFGTGSDDTYSVGVGDMDGDGALDIVAGNRTGQSLVYLNDGDGDFVATRPFGTASDETFYVAVGDLNGDGSLDIIQGNSGSPDPQNNMVYLNDGSGHFDWAGASLSFGAETDGVAVTVGDMNGDGPLDIVVGAEYKQNVVYLNDGSGDLSDVLPFGPDNFNYPTWAVAVGDVDADGALDVVLGKGDEGQGLRNRVCLNNGYGSLSTCSDISTIASQTRSIALGDVDGDGHLDVVTGNDAMFNRIYVNDGMGGFSYSLSFGYGVAYSVTYGIALGDVNSDGPLDIVVGNAGQNMVFLNDSDGTGGYYTGAVDCSAPPASVRCFGSGSDTTNSIALGDLDGDSDLDIAAGNGSYAAGERNMIYLNDGAGRFTERGFGTDTERTLGIALGDMNGDGNLDIVTANGKWPGQRNLVFLNDGGGGFPASNLLGMEQNYTYGLAVGDMDGDGDLDVVAANGGIYGDEQSWVYLNDGSGTFGWATPSRRLGAGADAAYGVAVGDLNGDGTLDVILGNKAQDEVYLNGIRQTTGLVNNPPSISAVRPGPTANGNLFSTPAILESTSIPITYTLRDLEGDLVGHVTAYYSPDGGGRWLPAISTGDTITTNIPLSKDIIREAVYTWDTVASGFFGQSDNVVLRFLAHSPPTIDSASGTYRYTNTVPGPYHWPYAPATTFPFRARGTQIRVVSGTLPIPGAIVYRLPEGQLTAGALMASGAGTPFRTDERGYLQGRGEIYPGDHLMAMLPVSATDSYTVYFTSASPTLTGLNAYTVTSGGVQTLTTSSDNPLILFNLDFSMEWDAHKDTAYLEQLHFYLQRASEYLYDFTNGQVALGHVNVFQNADEWVFSHVVVRANNRLRPFAIQGGIVTTDTIDPHHNAPTDTIRYSPGQVTIGSVWNRYGNPGQSLGEDWPIILAHELSHFLLFHDDVYLGMDDTGNLISVDTCLGSAMGDLYDRPDNTEFIADEAFWQSFCHNTLAEQTLGRNEWETMQLWYQWLISPTATNPGPSIMPFDFTHILIHDPYTPTDTLVDPTFYIDYDGGGSSSSEARAYLLRDEYVINLGSPFGGQNRVVARGAQAGDRLCVFDRPSAQFGCESIDPGDDRLAMRKDAGWNPIITLTPINSTTLAVNLTNAVSISFPLHARVFPDLGYAPDPITLTPSGNAYSGTFSLTFPTLSGNLQVWVDESATETSPRRETIIAYTIGGNPGMFRGAGGMFRGAGGMFRGAGGMFRGAGGMFRGAGAPILSADGQMIFFTENPIDFITGTLFAIQGMAGLPPLPPGRTLVGQGYNLLASPGYSLPVGSVSIQYLSNDVLVAGASEPDLALYFWNGDTWSALDTVLDTYFNLASAPSHGEGVYALMASIKISLHGPGWNNFAYAAQGSQLVTQALLSISGHYTTVYGYQSTDTLDPWKVYDVTVDDWVNSLRRLEFGKGYWINVSQSITLHLGSTLPTVTGDQVAHLDEYDMLFPPSTFYGALLSQNGFTPTIGMTMTARVLPGDIPCGQSRTREVDGQVVYVVDVFADGGPGSPTYGCGASGRTVRFDLDGLPMFPVDTWDNRRLWRVDLSPASSTAYLPLVLR